MIDLNGKALAKGTDYDKTFSYAYAEEVTLADGTLTGTYRITAKSITGASVTVKPQIYTGYEVKPGKDQITKIKVGKEYLEEGDYEIIGYTNNIKKGTAKMTLRGVGDYGGTKTVTFKIVPRNVVWWTPEEKRKLYDMLQNLLQFN